MHRYFVDIVSYLCYFRLFPKVDGVRNAKLTTCIMALTEDFARVCGGFVAFFQAADQHIFVLL